MSAEPQRTASANDKCVCGHTREHHDHGYLGFCDRTTWKPELGEREQFCGCRGFESMEERLNA